MMDIKAVLFQWFINVLINKTFDSSFRNENISKKELAKELHKLIIRKFKNKKVRSPFIDNIWGQYFIENLADIQLISK